MRSDFYFAVNKRILSLSYKTWLSVSHLEVTKYFGMQLRLEHLREIFLRCGGHISSLDISRYQLTNLRIPSLIGKFFLNLHFLPIVGTYIIMGWWPQNKTVRNAVMWGIVGKVLSIPTTFV